MIKRIELENFLPFRKRVTLPLDNQGLIAVRGRNLVSASCDANGVGKTSLAHGISWVAWGEDLAGRKADAVACRFTTGTCEGQLHFEDDLGPWGISRSRRPTNLVTYGIAGVLENEDAAVLQKKIDQRLGFGLRTFKNAGVFGQGNFDRFAKADQAEAMRMLDEIQGIDFRDALQRSKDWRSELTEKLTAAQAEAEKARLQADAAGVTIASLREARDAFEVDRATRLKELDAEMARNMAAVNGLADEDKKVEADRVLLAKLREAGAVLNDASAAENAAIEIKEAAEREVMRAEEALQEATDALAALESAGECPTCRRGVKTKTDLTKVRKLFEPTLALCRATANVKDLAMRKAREAAQEATRVADSAQVARDALVPVGEEDPSRLIARLEVATGSTAGAKRAAEAFRLGEAASQITQATRKVREASWGGADALAGAEAAVRSHREKERKASGRVVKIEVALAMADYWVEAFGDRGIRSLMVDGVADYANDRVRQHLEILAAGEATMLMSATTDLKKGGTKEKISWSPVWAWGGTGEKDGSGGQDRRMDLAVFGAIQDLAENRSARPFPIKIWDQPEADLDARGKELFCQWVAKQARERGTGILISHDREIADSVTPDHTWTVVLDDDGAHVEVDA